MGRSPSEVIISELTRIRTSLDRFEQQESATKEAFSSLYAEMEDYKKGALFELERHILNDLLIFFDGIQWSVEHSTDTDTTNQINDDLLDLLARYDVVPVPPSTTFDAKIHRVLQVVETDNPDLDGQISSVLKKGFYRKDKILRVEDVTMYRLATTAS